MNLHNRSLGNTAEVSFKWSDEGKDYELTGTTRGFNVDASIGSVDVDSFWSMDSIKIPQTRTYTLQAQFVDGYTIRETPVEEAVEAIEVSKSLSVDIVGSVTRETIDFYLKRFGLPEKTTIEIETDDDEDTSTIFFFWEELV